ncbi:hypothetical protein H4R33_004060, partial [Dimargaris cristalligena]
DFLTHVLAKDQETAQSFWADQFADVEAPSLLTEPHHQLAGDIHPNDPEYYGRVLGTISNLTSVEKFAQNLEVTMSSVLRASLAAVLQRYTGSDNPVFGTIVSGRNVPLDGIENMVGLCINTVPCCIPLGTNLSVQQVLQNVHANSVVMYDYEHCRLTDIHRWSGLSSEQPLFNILFVLENYPEPPTDPTLPIQIEVSGGWDPTDYALAIAVYTDGDELKYNLTYRRLDFGDTFAARFADHFSQAVRSMINMDPLTSFGDVELFSAAERQELLQTFATNDQPLPNEPVHASFQRLAQSAPDLIALVQGNHQFTYAQLNAAADRLADTIKQLTDCGPDHIIAILANQSVELIICQLAIWKSGAAFVCLVPEYPTDRKHFILKDTQSIALLGRPEHLADWEDSPIPIVPVDGISLLNDAQPTPAGYATVSPSSLAYVVYTSGSTGTPKGVMIEQGSVSSFIRGFGAAFVTNQDVIVPVIATPTFDMSILEIWSTLSFGGTSLIHTGDFEATLQQVTQAYMVPSLLSSFTPLDFPRLKRVVVGGDVLTSSTVQVWGAAVDLFNLYGPTECTIATHFTRLFPGHTISVGSPGPNATCFILDSKLRPVPIGATGQLYLGGTGVARGYLNQPELTQEKFITYPLTDERIYQSGDLARWLPNGQVEYLGRIDNQVKLRGFRIELGEIESALEGHPLVEQACAILQGNAHLVGYVVPPTGQTATILDSLRTRLPPYMVPSVLVELSTWPLTRVGKIDRKALPKYDFTLSESVGAIQEYTQAEAKMVALVAEVLDVESSAVSLGGTFFQLGGNSLTAIQLVSRCRHLNLNLVLADINRQNTIYHLAKLAVAQSAAIDTFDFNEDGGYESSPETS